MSLTGPRSFLFFAKAGDHDGCLDRKIQTKEEDREPMHDANDINNAKDARATMMVIGWTEEGGGG